MYMYQMLSKAIFDSEDKNKIKSEWSPNAIRNIVILRDCIIVVYHTTRQTKFVQLNQEALDDIMSNGSKGALHNVLGAYQLSCLEEIYVDSVFQNYLGTFNLDKYVNGLKNTRSRLRYCGYVQWVMGAGQNIFNYYNKGKQALSEDYTLAQSKGVVSIGIQSLENTDWYMKHNLRPENYKLDKERGTLDAWFTKVERDMTEYYGEMKKAANMESLDKLYCNLLDKSLYDIKYYRYWYTALKLIKDGKTNWFARELESSGFFRYHNLTFSCFDRDDYEPVYISKEKLVYLYNKYFKEKISKEDFLFALWCFKTWGRMEKATDEYMNSLVETLETKNKKPMLLYLESGLKSHIAYLIDNDKTKKRSLFILVTCERNGLSGVNLDNLKDFIIVKLLHEEHKVGLVIKILCESFGFSLNYLDEIIKQEDSIGGKA